MDETRDGIRSECFNFHKIELAKIEFGGLKLTATKAMRQIEDKERRRQRFTVRQIDGETTPTNMKLKFQMRAEKLKI
ncbi:hypothetical protein QYF36_007710 [Acer negundo]|nr:hypothetical protein QYF36_007710 [Acer negundo]